MSSLKLCILGGSGFVGRHLARRLVRLGHRVRVITRRRERHKRFLLVLPTLELVEGDVHNPAALRRYVEGMDVVVNLVGILNESGRSGRGFERVHVELPRKIVNACREMGVRRLLHMSALHASEEGPSHYLRTKGRGEEVVHSVATNEFRVTSFRPSVIFGPEDSFINRFAALLRISPLVFPLACPNARFQPVYVGDVVEAFARSLTDHHTFGQRYDLCGPKVYRLREIVDYVARLLGLRRRVIGLGDRLSKLQAVCLEFMPGKPFSLDNYRSLQVDSVCARASWPVFGIEPQALEGLVPRYLGKQRPPSERYSSLRQDARRR